MYPFLRMYVPQIKKYIVIKQQASCNFETNRSALHSALNMSL